MRRTRLFMEAADSGAGAAEDVAQLMGRLLGWGRRQRAGSIARYQMSVEASQMVLTGDTADVPA